LQPDLTILFDVSPAVGRQRAGRRRKPDRFEREKSRFYQRVRRAYLRRARQHPRRIRIIDSSRSLLEVKKELEKLLLSYC
jgi:dTMP kinase